MQLDDQEEFDGPLLLSALLVNFIIWFGVLYIAAKMLL
jgi:hypothetical protein